MTSGRLALAVLLALSASAVPAQTGPAVAATAGAGTVAVDPGAPGRIEVPEPVFDAGKVDRGTIITHEFEVRNVGAGVLAIEAKAGCGCTVVTFDREIQPGAVGKVAASVKTDEFRGDITKTVTLSTSDSANSRVVLEVRAFVQAPVTVEPDRLVLDGAIGSIKPLEVSVTATDGAPFDIVSLGWSDERFTAEIAPILPPAGTDKPAKPPKPRSGTVASGFAAYKVSVTPSDDLPIGRYNATLTLATTHPKAAEIPVQLFAAIRGNLELWPDQVTLRLGPTATQAEAVQHVVIRKRTAEGRPLKITSVKSSLPTIHATLTPTTEGQEYDLAISYEGPPLTARQDAKVTVQTNDPHQRSLDIAVNAVAAVEAGARPAK